MDSYFIWYNLIYALSLVLGCVLTFGLTLGLSDFDGVDVGLEPDAADSDNFLLSALGFGKAPLVFVLVSWTLTFGMLGFLSNSLLSEYLARDPNLYGLASVAISLVGSLLCTAVFSRLLAKYVPSVESTSVAVGDMVGTTGKLITEVSPTMAGLATFRYGGDIFQYRVIAESGHIPSGTSICAVSFDAAQSLYVVKPHSV